MCRWHPLHNDFSSGAKVCERRWECRTRWSPTACYVCGVIATVSPNRWTLCELCRVGPCQAAVGCTKQGLWVCTGRGRFGVGFGVACEGHRIRLVHEQVVWVSPCALPAPPPTLTCAASFLPFVIAKECRYCVVWRGSRLLKSVRFSANGFQWILTVHVASVVTTPRIRGYIHMDHTNCTGLET